MYLKYVKLNNFRNFVNETVIPDEKINVFFGNNGNGKTNLAEAIFLLTKNKSFRKVKREDLINYNSDSSGLETEIDRITLKVIFKRQEKRVYINDKLVHNNKRLLETYFINSDLLFYFKNFSHFRMKLIDRMCYNIFGIDFLSDYKKYINAAKNLKKEFKSGVWLNIFQKYQKNVNSYRVEFFRRIRDNYNEAKEYLKLKDCLINFKGEEKREINITRNDRKDLSLGELKSVIFSIFYSVIKINGENKSLLIIDDFNSEWDRSKQKAAKELIKKIDTQSFIMDTENREEANFIIEKGEIIKL